MRIAWISISAGWENEHQAGIADMIPPDMCLLGWKESMQQLANLVEPEIPDGM